MQNRKLAIDIIGYDCGWGCADYGCEDGPAHIDMAQVLQALQSHDAKWLGALGIKTLGSHDTLDTKEKTLSLVQEALKRLSSRARDAAMAGRIPVTVGGDHSSAIGTFSGVISARQNAGRFGLIWMDAHMDAHTFETSYQGKWGGWWHGQPLASLTGQGLPAFTKLCGDMTKINPAHVSIIGPHSYEQAEVDYTKQYGIRVYYLEEVRARGFKAVFEEALARATTGTDGFGLSIDLDGFRGADAPGVGTAEEDGMVAAEVLPILESVAQHPLFQALEIVEFNPHNDIDHKTAQLVTRLFRSIFKERV